MDGMLGQAVVFCTFQPCPRPAEGDLEIETPDGVQRYAVCPRHFEFVVNELRARGPNQDMLSQEIVFTDDVDTDTVNQVATKGWPYAIVEKS